MSMSFRERLASDPYFTIHFTEKEKSHPELYCHISDNLLRQADPNSEDFDSQIDMMSRDEMKEHAEQVISIYRTEQKTKEKQEERNRFEGIGSPATNPWYEYDKRQEEKRKKLTTPINKNKYEKK